MKEIIKRLKKRGWCIGVMESCTGGAMANLVTDIPGASDVFKEGKVVYSDEAKIRAGVDREIIERYGVYSIETAKEMARKIRGEVGIGITGNLPGKVFWAVRVENVIKNGELGIKSLLENEIEARKEMKLKVVKKVVENLTKSDL